ncbi:MAG: phosphoglucosamine mutase [Candidatus Zixiibacteriota bacterium]
MPKDLMAGISGLRGVVGKGLNPGLLVKYSAAFGNFCKPSAQDAFPKVVLGRDSRRSGEMCRFAVLSGLLATGCEVIDIGVCPTPTAQIAVEGLRANGGIVVTASHNPIGWNALKFIGSDGTFLAQGEAEKLFDLVKNDKIVYQSWNGLGRVKPDHSWIDKHIKKALTLSYIDINKIGRRRLKVVIDCCNGAGGTISPDLLKALGCQVIELFTTPDGNFAHDPEPRPENLVSLCREVKKNKADVGFANDPDVDRLAIVSDRGIPLGEEATLALATKFILKKKPKSKVVTNISTSRMIDDIAKEFDSKVYRTKVGETYVVARLKAVKGIIGGEGNGGVVLPELHYGRDALVGMALILEYLAESKKSISDLASDLPKYFMIKKKGKLTEDFERNLAKLKRRYAKERIDLIDGVKIDFEDSWIHIRKSNTEPIFRIIAEAKSKKEVSRLVADGLKILVP